MSVVLVCGAGTGIRERAVVDDIKYTPKTLGREDEDEDVRIMVSVFFRVARTPPDQANMEETIGTRPNMASCRRRTKIPVWR